MVLLWRRQTASVWIKGSFAAVMWSQNHRRAECVMPKNSLQLLRAWADHWFSFSLVWGPSWLLITGPSSIFSETRGVILQESSSTAPCIQTEDNWSVTSVPIDGEDIVAQGFCQAGPRSACERLQVPAKGQYFELEFMLCRPLPALLACFSPQRFQRESGELLATILLQQLWTGFKTAVLIRL